MNKRYQVVTDSLIIIGIIICIVLFFFGIMYIISPLIPINETENTSVSLTLDQIRFDNCYKACENVIIESHIEDLAQQQILAVGCQLKCVNKYMEVN